MLKQAEDLLKIEARTTSVGSNPLAYTDKRQFNFLDGYRLVGTGIC
ncbi:hypothetical protein [Trichormus variabilis]|nr:hypothetical protein [Trichormus variabilis]MBD2626815.1 hypothetical protein [Trichormus variabilis FACHB-164]